MSDTLLPAPVLIVEDEPFIRTRLTSILAQLSYEMGSVHGAATLTDARSLVQKYAYALALVDLGLPDGNGIDLIGELRARDADMGILVISAWSTEDAILAALRAGATGYVLKERDDMEVMLSIRSVLRGGAPIDPFIARRVIDQLGGKPVSAASGQASGQVAMDALSAREHEILSRVADGLTNREIADMLCISRYTVDCHVKNIYHKLAVSSRVRAVNEARTRGLLP